MGGFDLVTAEEWAVVFERFGGAKEFHGEHLGGEFDGLLELVSAGGAE